MNKEAKIQAYITCAENNLTACLKKMQNQYGLSSKDTDWNEYNNNGLAKDHYDDMHPTSIGPRYTTDIEQCDETKRWLLNIQITEAKKDELKDIPTTPVFTFQYAGELDEQGEPLPLPTFMRKTSPPEGEVWDGTFYPVTICQQGRHA